MPTSTLTLQASFGSESYLRKREHKMRAPIQSPPRRVSRALPVVISTTSIHYDTFFHPVISPSPTLQRLEYGTALIVGAILNATALRRDQREQDIFMRSRKEA